MPYTLDVPHSIRNGLIFPNVTQIKLMQRSTGQIRIVDRSTLKAKLSTAKFDQMFAQYIDLTGEFMDDNYHDIAHSQTDPWGEDVT